MGVAVEIEELGVVGTGVLVVVVVLEIEGADFGEEYGMEPGKDLDHYPNQHKSFHTHFSDPGGGGCYCYY